MQDWHPDLFLWVHKLVLINGVSVQRTVDLTNEQVERWNKESPDDQRPLFQLKAMLLHFNKHIPDNWNDLAKVMQARRNETGLVPRGSGETPPAMEKAIAKIGNEAHQAMVDDVGRIESVLGKVMSRFEQLDASIDDSNALTPEFIPGYVALAKLVTGGIESMVKLRNTDKLVAAALTHFADGFALEAMDIVIHEVDKLVIDLRKKGHGDAADLVAIRVRDIMVTALTRAARKALEAARVNMKGVGAG